MQELRTIYQGSYGLETKRRLLELEGLNAGRHKYNENGLTDAYTCL
jgi:hypothetical protein